jgi:A/G-specific adenine glycosylase
MTTRVDLERNLALLTWYAERKRDLPWRDAGDPYLVLVSESMLQQTQAARVVPHFERFVERYPTVESLAAAPLADVLEVWSGLGYNTRARRLRDAARVVVAEGWPTTVDGLCRLPGVGQYTAAAIAAFGFGEQVVTIDTNTRRVISRWNGEPLSGVALRAATEAALGEPAAEWNQAVMDLGATVCLARVAHCEICPVAAWCAGPEGYVATTSQGRFEGSARQLRGAIVRAVVLGPRSVHDLVQYTGFPIDEVELALDELVEEGLLAEQPDDTYRIED